MKNEKKKHHPTLALGIGALAVYGAYSMVKCVKDGCVCKMSKMKNIFKKKDAGCECVSTCECGSEEEN
jgi:hypothetical protein